MARNAADPKEVMEQEQLEAFLAQQKKDDLAWLMDDPRGRRFMWDLLGRCGVFRTSFTGNSTTFFNEGQRNIGLSYLDEIHQDIPGKYLDMINEAQKGN